MIKSRCKVREGSHSPLTEQKQVSSKERKKQWQSTLSAQDVVVAGQGLDGPRMERNWYDVPFLSRKLIFPSWRVWGRGMFLKVFVVWWKKGCSKGKLGRIVTPLPAACCISTPLQMRVRSRWRRKPKPLLKRLLGSLLETVVPAMTPMRRGGRISPGT